MHKYLKYLSILITAGLFLSSCSTGGKKDNLGMLNLRMGTNYLAKGQPRKALQYLLEAKAHDDDNHLIYSHLSLTYLVLGDLTKAETNIKKSLEIEPEFSEGRNNYSRILIEQKKYKEAIEQARIVLQDQTYVGREKAYNNIGIAQFRLQQFDAAQKTFEKSLTIKRNDCLAQNYLGRTYFEKKDFITSSKVLDRAVSSCFPQDFDEPHYFSALSYFKRGQKTEAVARLREISTNYKNGRYKERAEKALKKIE
jgi:type IV pilus assembly protein PilF